MDSRILADWMSSSSARLSKKPKPFRKSEPVALVIGKAGTRAGKMHRATHTALKHIDCIAETRETREAPNLAAMNNMMNNRTTDFVFYSEISRA